MNFTVLNVVWTLITLVGFLASSRILYECWKDHQYVKHAQINSTRGLISRTAIVNEFSRTLVQLFFVLLGLISIIAPQRYLTTSQAQIFGNVVIGMFIVVALVLALTSLVGNIERKLVIDSIDRSGDVD